MYEIIADPQDYQIDHLINGTDNGNIELSREERDKWALEISGFSDRLTAFSQKAGDIANLLSGSEKISTTAASLKTLKIQLFKINETLDHAVEIANKLEADIIEK